MGNFMYFPDNKLEYIPAFLQVAVFFLIALLVFQFIRRVSARQAEKAKQQEEEILRNNGYNSSSPSTENEK